MKKVLVCRVGKEPEVEEVRNPFEFCKDFLINGGYVENKTIVVGDERVVAYWEELNPGEKRPFNRNVPAMCPFLPEDVDFIVDTRIGPPESYAKPGEMGYFAIYGNFLITKARSNDGAHISLSDRSIKTFSALLSLPKCKRCKVNTLAYPGAVYCGAACSAMAEAGD